MKLNSRDFALMLDDLKPMPIIKQIMVYNRRSESIILPEYLDMVIKTNADITNLFDDLFNCDESTLPEDKLKLYRKLLTILDDIKTNFFKPMKFNPVFDFIENFVVRNYNPQEKSPLALLYETVKNHILNENYLSETY